MHCPRCGAPNDDARAACWNCFAQVRLPADVKAEKRAASKAPKPPKPEKPKKEKKGKKDEAVIDTAAEPVIVPEPVVEPAAPIAVAAAVDSAPVELDAVPTEVTASEEPAPLGIPPITASVEPETPDFSTAPSFGDFTSEPAEDDNSFIAGIPMGQDTETEPAATFNLDQDSSFVAGIPMGDDTDATPNNARVMDLDAPIDNSSYIIPGLADESPEKPLGEDIEEPDDMGPMAFDLDSEEPGKKPEGPSKQ